MKLSKDKAALIYNEFLTLEGIPPAKFAYRLGNRSALEWVIDQDLVNADKRSGITNDPDRPDDPEYIVRHLSGTTHNVFGIQVGVSINIFVRKRKEAASPKK